MKGNRFLVLRAVLVQCMLLLHALPELNALGYSEIGAGRYFGVHTVAISSRSLSLHFEGDADAQYIMVDGVDLPTRYRVESEREGGVLRIRIIGDAALGAPSDAAGVFLKVPAHLRIIADSLYGDISVQGVGTGPLQLSSGTGTVRVSDSDVDLVLETESGKVVVERVSGDAVLTAGRGEIDVRGFEGSLTAHTTLGSQHYTQVRGALGASTNSGMLVLEDVQAWVKLTSTHGGVLADSLRLEGDSEIRSLSGDLVVGLRNALTELELILESGPGGRIFLNQLEVESGFQQPALQADAPVFRAYVGAGVLQLQTDLVSESAEP